MVRDAPRDSIPESSVYDSRDFLLDQPGLARKRGGTSYAGPALTAASYTHTVQHTADSGNVQRLVGIGDNGHLYTVTSGTTSDVSTLGSTYLPLQKMTFIQDKLIICGNDGATDPKYYDGSSVAIVDATAPQAKYSEAFKGRLVLANTGNGGSPGNNPNRMWFSPATDITDPWDADAWIDADYAITGLCANASMLLIFSRGHTEKIVGSIPPGSAQGSNMNKTLVGAVGCTDARSIGVFGNLVIFANTQGVYTTNGVGFECLTDDGGMSTYWKSLFPGYVRTSWSISGEVFGEYYIVTVMNGSTKVDTLMCHIPRRAWWRLTNIPAGAYTVSHNVYPELYFADRTTNRIGTMSGIFLPTAANKADADGTAVTPQMEMKLVGSGPWLKHFGFMRIMYDMRDASSDDPSLAVSVAKGIEATTYAELAQSPLRETTDVSRKRMTISKVSQGVNIKLVQSNASSKTEIYSTETEQRYVSTTAGGT